MNYQRVHAGHSAAQHSEAIEYQADTDEISLSDLLWTLWRGRALIVLFPLLGAAIAALATIGMALKMDDPTVYYVNLKGIEGGQYPNGTAFSPQDLTGPAILAELRGRYNIARDIKLADAIVVTYGNPVSAGLTQAYQEKLSGRNLSAADIARINDEYQRQLNSAMQSMLRVEVNHHLLDLDASAGAVIAHAIPEIWSDHFSQNVRIFTDTRLADASISAHVEDLQNTASSVLGAKQRLQAMENGLKILAGDNRLSLLRTGDGYSVEDVTQELRRFKTVYFNTIVSLGFQASDSVGSAYLTDLKLQLKDLRRKLTSYDDTLRDLRTFQNPNGASGVTGRDSGSFSQNSFQLGETGFSEVVQLARRASFAEFVQEVLRAKQEVAYQIADTEREIEQATLEGGDSPPSPEFRQHAAGILEQLTRRYSELLDSAQTRIRTHTGALYAPATSAVQSGSLLPKSSMLVIVFASGLGLLLAIVIILIRASLRNSLQRN